MSPRAGVPPSACARDEGTRNRLLGLGRPPRWSRRRRRNRARAGGEALLPSRIALLQSRRFSRHEPAILAAHAGRLPLVVSARRSGHNPGRRRGRVRRRRRARGLGLRLDRARRARRCRRGLPPLQGLLLVMPGVFSTPRPVPGRRVPTLAGAAVVVLALPVFLVGGFSVSGWALAAVLWAAGEALGLWLTR